MLSAQQLHAWFALTSRCWSGQGWSSIGKPKVNKETITWGIIDQGFPLLRWTQGEPLNNYFSTGAASRAGLGTQLGLSTAENNHQINSYATRCTSSFIRHLRTRSGEVLSAFSNLVRQSGVRTGVEFSALILVWRGKNRLNLLRKQLTTYFFHIFHFVTRIRLSRQQLG